MTLLAEGQRDASQGALRLLWRLYNDQQVRCLHHPAVQKLSRATAVALRSRHLDKSISIVGCAEYSWKKIVH